MPSLSAWSGIWNFPTILQSDTTSHNFWHRRGSNRASRDILRKGKQLFINVVQVGWEGGKKNPTRKVGHCPSRTVGLWLYSRLPWMSIFVIDSGTSFSPTSSASVGHAISSRLCLAYAKPDRPTGWFRSTPLFISVPNLAGFIIALPSRAALFSCGACTNVI